MKKVITYGTFDLLHVGHINILRRAKELGDYLLVVLSTDEFNAIKNKKAYYSYEDRKQILEAIRYVDEVIPENTWNRKFLMLLTMILMCLLWDMTGRENLISSRNIVKLFICQEQKEFQHLDKK